MALTEEEIKALFPKGAVQTRNRFKPARSKPEATKTLARLLADKKKRMQPERYLARSGPQRLRWSAKEKRWVVKHFEGDEEHGYTLNPSRSLDGIPAAPRDIQERFDTEAKERAERPLFERVKDLEGRVRPEQLASLRSRVTALERIAKSKAA